MPTNPSDRSFPANAGLPEQWQGREHFVVLDTGFPEACSFIATWRLWRDHAADEERCSRLIFVSIVPAPPTRPQLQAALVGCETPDLAAELIAAWPPVTPGLHSLRFDGGRVEWMLLFGMTLADGLRKLVLQVDAFQHVALPAFDASGQSLRIAKALGRLAAPRATLFGNNLGSAERAGLITAGFVFSDSEGRPTQTARFAPRFGIRPRSTNEPQPSAERHVLIVGAGLAGCAAAWALAEQGWRSTVFERQGQPAAGASGNPAGLFHCVVHEPDSHHARFNRAAALEAATAVRAAIGHGAAGAADGLLRLESVLDAAQMRAMLERLGLPADHVDVLDAAEASARAGIRLSSPCWFFADGGWVQPAGLARSFLKRAGDNVDFRPNVEITTLQRTASGWRLLNAAGKLIDEASTVVLANAEGAFRLIDSHQPQPVVTEQVRGQISLGAVSVFAAPKVPISGSGYLLPAVNGQVMFGATAQPGDTDASVRAADHRLNLARLARLTGRPDGIRSSHPDEAKIDRLEGRTAFRCSAIDRLPLIGRVVDRTSVEAAGHSRPRPVPRLPGLYLFSGLGSRGITWSALGARLLAAQIAGAPLPLEADLVDAVDPARFVVRELRRSQPKARPG